MYTSNLFKLAFAYCVKTYDAVLILSAKWGAISPDKVIEPYDRRLSVSRRDHYGKCWGSAVHCDLLKYPLNAVVYVHAGADYVSAIRTIRPEVEAPLEGLQIGERLRWYKERLAGKDTAHV